MNTEQAIKLPLWLSCVTEMRSSGVSYGKTYPAEYFEGWLKESRDSVQFKFDISAIRKELLHDGYYLKGHDSVYVIISANRNRNVIARHGKIAVNALTKGLTLGINTKTNAMSDEDRRRHESALEKIATRYALMKNADIISSHIKNTKPSLIKISD